MSKPHAGPHLVRGDGAADRVRGAGGRRADAGHARARRGGGRVLVVRPVVVPEEGLRVHAHAAPRNTAVTAQSLFAEIRFYGLMFTFYSVIVMLSEHFTRKKKSIKVVKKTFYLHIQMQTLVSMTLNFKRFK